MRRFPAHGPRSVQLVCGVKVTTHESDRRPYRSPLRPPPFGLRPPPRRKKERLAATRMPLDERSHREHRSGHAYGTPAQSSRVSGAPSATSVRSVASPARQRTDTTKTKTPAPRESRSPSRGASDNSVLTPDADAAAAEPQAQRRNYKRRWLVFLVGLVVLPSVLVGYAKWGAQYPRLTDVRAAATTATGEAASWAGSVREAVARAAVRAAPPDEMEKAAAEKAAAEKVAARAGPVDARASPSSSEFRPPLPSAFGRETLGRETSASPEKAAAEMAGPGGRTDKRSWRRPEAAEHSPSKSRGGAEAASAPGAGRSRRSRSFASAVALAPNDLRHRIEWRRSERGSPGASPGSPGR